MRRLDTLWFVIPALAALGLVAGLITGLAAFGLGVFGALLTAYTVAHARLTDRSDLRPSVRVDHPGRSDVIVLRLVNFGRAAGSRRVSIFRSA